MQVQPQRRHGPAGLMLLGALLRALLPGCVALRAGAIADILVVDGNPLTDISCLLGQGEGIPVIIKDGKIYKGQE